jgi:hypothetical protein
MVCEESVKLDADTVTIDRVTVRAFGGKATGHFCGGRGSSRISSGAGRLDDTRGR